MRTIENYIESLQEEFKRLSYEEDFTGVSSAERLLYLYAYYHYFNADSSKIEEIIHGNVYEWGATDCIGGIYIDEDSDRRDIDLIIPVYVEDGTLETAYAIKSLKDAEVTVLEDNNFKKTLRTRIKEVVADDDYKLSNERPVKIIFITNYSPKGIVQKNSIKKTIESLKPDDSCVSYQISFGANIEYEILEIEDPKEYVNEGVIEIDWPNNWNKYGNEDSIIVNISAKSLKRLYELYSYRGLFAQNLRYYVKSATVDSNVVDSIQNHPENFWYYNNGIIMICDDYRIAGNEITVSNFSIINGGQTTKLIGETDFETDFYLQCKIVKNKYDSDDERIEFIAKVAEASNTQKPIKSKDLIANKPEQRRLKKQLADSGIYCQIKRGEKVNKKLYPAAWQNTTNEELGQFILSFMYQRPGAARGNKASITGNADRYFLLFGKKYASLLLGDLLLIKAYYKQWTQYVKKNNDGLDPYKVGLVNNGLFYTTAIIGTLCKMYYHDEYIKIINASTMNEQRMETVSQFDIDHSIFKEVSDRKEQMYELFEFCYSHVYRPGYEFFHSFKPGANNFSNFTKLDSNYQNYVFRQLCNDCRDGLPGDYAKILTKYLYVPTEEEKGKDQELLDKYVNVIYVDAEADTNVPEEIIAKIKDALIEYRTKTYKSQHLKAYEIFRNASADRIAKFAPTSIEDLESLRCLDKTQLENYGEKIIEIVKRILL